MKTQMCISKMNMNGDISYAIRVNKHHKLVHNCLILFEYRTEKIISNLYDI